MKYLTKIEDKLIMSTVNIKMHDLYLLYMLNQYVLMHTITNKIRDKLNLKYFSYIHDIVLTDLLDL